jgi:bacterial/archaeal transporter family protein
MSTTLLSVLSGIAGMFGWGIYDFLGGVFARRLGTFKSVFWSQLAGFGSILLLAIVLTTGINLPFLTIILFPIAAVAYSAGYLFFYKGLEMGNVSIVAATMNLWAVFTMTFAFIFFGQRLSSTQLFGVMLIISGVALASINWSAVRKQSFQLSAGVREALLGAFFFGVFWNISEMISEEVGWLLTTLLVKFGIVVFLLILSFLLKQEIGMTKTAAKTRYALVFMGVIEVGAVAVVNYALTIGDAILITPIASALSIVTITLAVIFLKDRLSKLQGLGIVTAVAGIVVTAF